MADYHSRETNGILRLILVVQFMQLLAACVYIALAIKTYLDDQDMKRRITEAWTTPPAARSTR